MTWCKACETYAQPAAKANAFFLLCQYLMCRKIPMVKMAIKFCYAGNIEAVISFVAAVKILAYPRSAAKYGSAKHCCVKHTQ
jgi:hypothetical protein